MKIKKLLIVLIIILTLTTGCIEDGGLDNVKLLTTNYPIQFLTENIYDNSSNITSIYPKDIDIDDYKLTKKQIKEFSKYSIFIYDGLTEEKDTAALLLNQNNNLKLIDATKGMSVDRSIEELWLSPANFLMLAGNIYNDLDSVTSSAIIKQNLETKYEEVKLIISKFDADIKTIAENGNNTIIVGNDVFEFLEKYGFNVLSLKKNDYYDPYEKEYAKNGILDESLKYIFILDTDEKNENVKELEELGAEVVVIKSMKNLSKEDYNDGINYISMMNEFIEYLRNEAYN